MIKEFINCSFQSRTWAVMVSLTLVVKSIDNCIVKPVLIGLQWELYLTDDWCFCPISMVSDASKMYSVSLPFQMLRWLFVWLALHANYPLWYYTWAFTFSGARCFPCFLELFITFQNSALLQVVLNGGLQSRKWWCFELLIRKNSVKMPVLRL